MTFKTLRLRPDIKGLKQAIEAAQLVLKGALWGLTLTGAVGTGKTHVAVATGWAWAHTGRRCRFWASSAMWDELRDGYRQDGEHAFLHRFRVLMRMPLLIIDDVGTEVMSDWVQEKLDNLVDFRYREELPLLITCNVPLTELPDRVADRLDDKRKARVVYLSGPSYRQVRVEI